MSEYIFNAYCDICKENVGWGEDYETAVDHRQSHFDDEHPDNPLLKANCRIQREVAGE